MIAILIFYLYWLIIHWLLFFFKQKTAYEMRISDWSSDVCSSDLTTPPIAPLPDTLTPEPKKRWTMKRILLWFGLPFLGLLILLTLGGWLWYHSQLSPASSASGELVLVTIEEGSTPQMIGELLQEKGVIRSADRKSTRLNSSH